MTGPNGGTLASFTYDAMGRVATTTDAGGETVGYTWDNLNRLTMTSYPDGTSRQSGYDKLDPASVTDRLGHSTYYTHDADRNLIAVESAGGRITYLGYDGNGNLTSLSDPNGNTTYWDYNANRQPVARIYADGSVETYMYTSGAGWLDQVTDPLGQITRHGYTTDGRVNSITYENAQVATPAVSVSYDPQYPRVSSMTDGTGTTTYSYGAVGTPGANRLETVSVPGPSATIGHAYDALGRVSTRTIGSDTETFQRDALGRLVEHQNALGDFTFGYLGDTGQVTSMTPAGSPFSVTYQYLDNTNDRRLAAIANNDTGDTPLNFSYTTSADDLATGMTVSAGPSPSASWTYGYDPDNRLRSATEAGTVNEAARAFQASYNALNQIAQLNGTGYSYDADGELTGDGVNTYTWDAAHRLASVTSIASGDETSYTYDGLGRRIAITAHAQSAQQVTRYYLWCDARICQERDSGNNVTAQYFAEGEAQGGQALLYARDRLGSVVNLVDGSSGAVVAAYSYDPWGKVTSQSGSYTARFGYAGMFTDAGTGLNLTLYRAYSPEQNRWLSRDPMGEGVGANLYEYVGGNPVSRIDPFGLYQMCNRSLEIGGIPYARHCYVKFANGTTSSFSDSGSVGPDPEPNKNGTVCTNPKEPEKDSCIDREMKNCQGKYSFSEFNCCHCVEQALKSCGTSIPASSWPNWPINPGPQLGEPGYSPFPIYGPGLGK